MQAGTKVDWLERKKKEGKKEKWITTSTDVISDDSTELRHQF